MTFFVRATIRLIVLYVSWCLDLTRFFVRVVDFFFLHCFNATCLSPHKKILRVSIFWGHLTRVRVGVESVALYVLPKKKPTFHSYIQNCIVLS